MVTSKEGRARELQAKGWEPGQSCAGLELQWDQLVSAGPPQQGGVKMQSSIKMSWQPGLGVLLGANGRENCRTRPGSRKTLQSLLQVRV